MEFNAWVKKNGYATDDGPTEKFNQMVERIGHFDDALWHLDAAFLQESGYAGMWDTRFHNLVVWDLEVMAIQ